MIYHDLDQRQRDWLDQRRPELDHGHPWATIGFWLFMAVQVATTFLVIALT